MSDFIVIFSDFIVIFSDFIVIFSDLFNLIEQSSQVVCFDYHCFGQKVRFYTLVS